MDDKKVATKSIFMSKTFWVNIIGIVALFVQQKWGYVIDPTMQVQILGVVNVLLRSVTKEEVKWKMVDKKDGTV